MALSLVAGVAVGLVVAALQFRGSSVSGAVAQLNQAQMDKLAAQVSQLTQERDAARVEMDKLRETAAKAASASAAGSCPDRHTPWQPSAERDKTYPELAEFLKKVGMAGSDPEHGCTGVGGCCSSAGAVGWCCTPHVSARLASTPLPLPLHPLTRWPSTTRFWCRSATRTTRGRAACCSCGRRM